MEAGLEKSAWLPGEKEADEMGQKETNFGQPYFNLVNSNNERALCLHIQSLPSPVCCD